jgi:hypothetical protein
VRYYTTKAMNGGTTFTCTFCAHSVTTLDFDSTNGNRRTQAAAVINQHASSLHLRTSVPSKLGGRGAL